VADVFDGAAGGRDAQELPLMGAAEGQPGGYSVALGDQVIDTRVQVCSAACRPGRSTASTPA
jgi:hypothetical protein